MQRKKHLYEYFYEILKEQIHSGQLEYGRRLLSVNQYSEQYHMGAKTIRMALKLLQEEGLIYIQERKRAVVIYKAPFLDPENTSIRAIVQKRSAILEIYQTLELLMPDIIALCSKSIYVYELPTYEKVIKWKKRSYKTKSWQLSSSLVHDVLRASSNLLFDNLATTLEMYAEIPFLAEHQRTLTSYTPLNEIDHVDSILECLQLDYHSVRHRFREQYQIGLHTIEKSFDLLKTLFPDVSDKKAHVFSWDISWDALYKKIGRQIIEKIGLGIYPAGTFLPSESKLMDEYGVSLTTIRKILKKLQTLGFIETINGRGSKVLSHEQWKLDSGIDNPIYQQDILIYMSGLQLMPFVIRPAAILVWEQLDNSIQLEIQEQFNQKPANYMKVWIDCISLRVPLYPLKVILEQVNEILNWGYFYSFYTSNGPTMQSLNRLGLKALTALQHRDQIKFANTFYESYVFLLQKIRDLLIQSGLSQAKRFLLPEKIGDMSF